MGKYVVQWTEEDWYEVLIDADSADDALNSFNSGSFDRGSARHVGCELQDSVAVKECSDEH